MPSRIGKVLGGLRSFNQRPDTVDAVRRLRRLLPGDPGFGDPLSSAGRSTAAVAARVAGQLAPEQPRATSELALGGLQVWHSLLERAGRGRGDREVTVLFTDLVGFSAWAMRAGDEDALALLRAVARAVEPPVQRHGGRVVKRLGDGLMAVFAAPQAALDALGEARQRLAEVEVAGYRPVLRAGLHTGVPRSIGDDYLGVDVNIAARLAERAGPGETLVSEPALGGLDASRVAARRKMSFRLARVKGVPRDLGVYVVTRHDPAEPHVG